MPLDILKLDSFALLQVAGPDAEKFLQGQLTCDVQATTAEQWHGGAHCNHKGRMIANFLISRPAVDEFLLLLPRDVIAVFKASLDKYIVFSKADICDLTASHRLYGVTGEEASTWCESQEFQPHTSLASLDEQQVIGYCEGGDATLESAITQDSDQLWQAADILGGRGWITAATTEEFLPQMLNLDCEAIAAISFKKGCYTGQEIVARMHYKGQTKKRLYGFETTDPTESGTTPIKVGDTVFSGPDNKAVGAIINVCQPHDRALVLAVVSNDVIADNNALSTSNHDQKLQQIALPYAITS